MVLSNLKVLVVVRCSPTQYLLEPVPGPVARLPDGAPSSCDGGAADASPDHDRPERSSQHQQGPAGHLLRLELARLQDPREAAPLLELEADQVFSYPEGLPSKRG